MPPDFDEPKRPLVPVAAAVMLGLVLGIFGYILFLAVSFGRPSSDPLVFVPPLVLAPLAGVIARFAGPHWPTVATCVAMPTIVWSVLGAAFEPGAAAITHLGVAAMALGCAYVGAFVGRTIAMHDA